MKAFYSIALLVFFANAAAHAACTQPKAPKNLPNGKTATLEKMIDAQKAIKQFDAQTNDYIACLQTESDEQIARLEQSESDAKKKDEKKQKLQRALVKKQNAAVDADKAVAERFNAQLRVFKARENKSS